jgi:hypothetical protein
MAASNIILCLNPKCNQLASENVQRNFGTCGNLKCMTMMRTFGCQKMVSLYSDHIIILKQAPEYASNFTLCRNFFRNEIEKKFCSIEPSEANRFLEHEATLLLEEIENWTSSFFKEVGVRATFPCLRSSPDDNIYSHSHMINNHPWVSVRNPNIYYICDNKWRAWASIWIYCLHFDQWEQMLAQKYKIAENI